MRSWERAPTGSSETTLVLHMHSAGVARGFSHEPPGTTRSDKARCPMAMVTSWADRSGSEPSPDANPALPISEGRT